MIREREPRRLVIAIDGPAGAGKSTTARLLAERLGYRHVDTGALYRALAWKASKTGVAPDDQEGMKTLCRRTEIRLALDGAGSRIWVDGEELTDGIRTPEIGKLSSRISALVCVREHLLGLQRSLGKDGGMVMEGRDIGTVVFPDAEAKFFLDARPEERAARRFRELSQIQKSADFDRIAREVEERDRRDSTRAASPLVPAEDALVIDSTGLSPQEVVEVMATRIEKVRAALDPAASRTPFGGSRGPK